MSHSMVSEHLMAIVAAVVFVTSGVLFYFQRKKFTQSLKEALPLKTKTAKKRKEPSLVTTASAADASIPSGPDSFVSPKSGEDSSPCILTSAAEEIATNSPEPSVISSIAEVVVGAVTEAVAAAGSVMESVVEAVPASAPVDEPQADDSQPVDENISENVVLPSADPEVQRSLVASLHVSIWTYDRVLDKLSPSLALEALNDFHSAGAAWAETLYGVYERSSGASFYIHWADETGPAKALSCSLGLRKEFIRWNGTRKTDGNPPLLVVMGADVGPALLGRVGPQDRRDDAIIGEVVARSRALSQIASSLQTDILVTEELWNKTTGKYIGERVADAHLTALGNLTSCFRVKGYFGEQGQEVYVKGPDLTVEPSTRHADAPRVEKSDTPTEWRVNNGTQILGPMSAKEIAQALYTMDLDFDCECWEEGRGNRVSIEKSGMFGAGQEADAIYWVFDGETIHGPHTENFLRTGMGRQVFSGDESVCEKSTLTGWKKLSNLRSQWKEKMLSQVASEGSQDFENVPLERQALEAAPLVSEMEMPVAAGDVLTESFSLSSVSAESALVEQVSAESAFAVPAFVVPEVEMEVEVEVEAEAEVEVEAAPAPEAGVKATPPEMPPMPPSFAPEAIPAITLQEAPIASPEQTSPPVMEAASSEFSIALPVLEAVDRPSKKSA